MHVYLFVCGLIAVAACDLQSLSNLVEKFGSFDVSRITAFG